jgi:diguanylate cyclase (GGDEF)-like protein
MKQLVHLRTKLDEVEARDQPRPLNVLRAPNNRRDSRLRPVLPILVSVVLLMVIGWQALSQANSARWSAITISSLITVFAIIVRQGIVVRDSRLLTSHLSQEVDRDSLTGLLNRRRIGLQIDSELVQAKASGRALGLALIDIDNFKAVNDTHGHATGDQVLKSISAILQRACRGSDIAARYAGDEFLLVLPGLDLDDAHLVGERLLKEVSRYRNSIAPSLGIDISISIGIAVSRECEKQAKHLIGIADQAMYDAKDAGKNQLVIVDADTKILDIEDHLRAGSRDDDFEGLEILPTAG